MSESRIEGLPDARNWPGLHPKPTRDEVLRRDAYELARKHGKDVTELLFDPLLRVVSIATATDSTLRRDLEGHVDIPAGVRSQGYVGWLTAGGVEVVLADDLSGDLAALVTVHECGHIRADALFDDRSEEAANVWAEAWFSA